MRRLALAIMLAVLSSAGLVAQVTGTRARPDTTPRQQAEHPPKESRADTLRGSFTTPGRKWWDVTFYDLHVAIQPNDSSIAGYNRITSDVRVPHLWRYTLIQVGECRAWVRYADPRDPRLADVVTHQADGNLANADGPARECDGLQGRRQLLRRAKLVDGRP